MFNPRNVVELLFKDYQHLNSTPIQEEEVRIKLTLKGILDNYVHDPNTWIEEELTLDIADDSDTVKRTRSGQVDNPEHDTDNFSQKGENVDMDVPVEKEEEEENTIPLAYKADAVQFWRSCKTKRRRSLKSMQHVYKKIKSISQLERWEKIVEKGGSFRAKLDEIERKVKDKFDEALEGGDPIHDLDVQRWALEAAKEILPDFTASPHWLLNFKKKYSICSRKINKFVTKVQMLDAERLKQNADNFVKKVQKDIERFGAENTYNSDQSGFTFELRSGRTLSTKGTKKVNVVVQRTNSLTHSYTVQPIVSAKGKFLKPMLVVLPEKGGDFGPQVKETLFQTPNLMVRATKSGKCTSDILQEWWDEVFYKQLKTDSVILLDSYGGFNKATVDVTANSESDGSSSKDESSSEEESETDESATDTADSESGRTIKVRVHRIPPGVTGDVQPLDRYGFRPIKNFVRKMSDRIMLQNYDFQLAVRNNVIRMWSLIFNLLCSPRFEALFEYGWYASGYTQTHPPPFQTPSEYCCPPGLGYCDHCDKSAFVRCSWCTQQLCFDHYVLEYHYCEVFVE